MFRRSSISFLSFCAAHCAIELVLFSVVDRVRRIDITVRMRRVLGLLRIFLEYLCCQLLFVIVLVPAKTSKCRYCEKNRMWLEIASWCPIRSNFLILVLRAFRGALGEILHTYRDAVL